MKDVIAGGNTRIDVRVELRRGTNFSLLTKGVDYKETITLIDTNEEVNNYSKAGRYEIVVEMIDPENFVIQNDNSVSFYAKSKTLYAKNAPFYATSKDYFEEGTELIVETYESRRDIIGIIGAENYDSISNIGKVYRVVGLFKNDEQLPLDNVSVYFETTKSDYYTYSDDALSNPYHNRTNVEVDVGVFLIEAERESNIVTIIIIAAAVAVVLIVLIVVVVKVVNNRKYKKARAGTKVDLEKLNQIANSANSARMNGTTPSVQTMMGVQQPKPPTPMTQTPPPAQMPPQPNVQPQQFVPNGQMPPQQPSVQPQQAVRPTPQPNVQPQQQIPRPNIPPQQPPMQNGMRPPQQPPQNGNPPPPINR